MFVLLAQPNKYRCVCVFIDGTHAKVIRYIIYIYIFVVSPYVVSGFPSLIR